MKVGSFKLINCYIYIDNFLVYSGRIEDAGDNLKKLNYNHYEIRNNTFYFWVDSAESNRIDEEEQAKAMRFQEIQDSIRKAYEESTTKKVEIEDKKAVSKIPIKKPITENDYVAILMNDPELVEFSDKDFDDMSNVEKKLDIAKLLYLDGIRRSLPGTRNDFDEQKLSHMMDSE